MKTDASVIIASYTYGDSNERLIGYEGGVRTYYACDGKVEYTESGSSTTPQWSKTYIYLGARLLSTLTPNGSGGQFVQYHHPDRLGTRLVTNAQDTNYFEQQTLPFGTALNESPPTGGATGSTNKRFTSYDRSATTGLDYALNRHYDPRQGRFTQVDPIGMGSTSLASPQTLNLYAYCINDPINHTDPSGLGFLKRLLNRIVNALIHAVITAVFAFLQTLIMTGGNFGAALVAGAVAGGADFLKQLGWPSKGYSISPGGTPQWNPNAVAILGGGPSGLSRYIIYNLTTTQSRINPNCIANSVAGGILGATRNLIRRISAASGKPVDTGLAIHDGIHVYAPAGATALVTALPAMQGKILHTGRQAKANRPADYRLGLMDIELSTPINGETYVMTLKDFNYSSMQKTGDVRPGAIGYVEGSANMTGESGLHVTLMPKSVYDQYIGAKPTGAKRDSVPFGALMDAARDSASPFRCP